MRLILNKWQRQAGGEGILGQKPEPDDESWVIRENIARFKKRLEEKLSDRERRIVERLLSEEQEKLRRLEDG